MRDLVISAALLILCGPVFAIILEKRADRRLDRELKLWREREDAS